ncbi:uncharacterized protein [Epargyreus clarus]|uniref:uncharacterized protein n=1 Tax=Epargyreus clarus TaxID=520877 RepID=UPI003C2D1895
MPTIAQKLCHDIVDPILASSSANIAQYVQSRKSFKSVHGNSSIRFAKPTKSIVIEKKKIVSQLEPSSKTVISQLKSKDRILRKEFVDVGVNTLISGPLRCDNNCVTNVRKRDQCSCKLRKKINFQASTKQVQTLNKTCSRSDKACTHCIDTMNTGTQFMENLNRLRTQISNRLLLNQSNEFEPQFSFRNTPRTSSRMSKTINLNQYGKRWALSSYPTRGPDF